MKISTNLKDVIESLSDLLTIGESNTIPDYYTDLLLKQDIKFDLVVNKNNYVLLKSLYFFDNKSFMYTLKLSNEEPEEKTKPSQLNIRLIPLRIKPVNASDFIHLHVIMLLEIIYRYNKDLLTDEQTEILRNYFIEHNPEVIDLDEKRTFIESIENIQTVFPPNQIKPIDKVTLKTFEGAIMFNDRVQVDVGKKPNSVYVDVALKLNENENIKGIEKFNEYDHAVHDAICTLWEYGNQHITPAMIYHVMTGNSETRGTQKIFEKITESIERMRRIIIYIDATDEAKKYKQLNQFKYDDYVISATHFELMLLNNELVNGYVLSTPPTLLNYAKQKKQISTIPMQLLNTPINKTNDIIILQNYLLKRISAMKNKNNSMLNVILYDAIYQQLDLKSSDEQAKTKKSRCRNNIKKILDFWKEQKFIKSYSENKKSGSFYNIEIVC